MNPEYEDCLKRGKIKKFSRGKALVSKELETAGADLERARKTSKEGDYKWATIQAYYAMFHAARAMLYARNLREHSHFCLIAAIRALYVVTKEFPIKYLEAFQDAKSLREEADYHNRWSQAGCAKLLIQAQEFLKKAGALVET
jgi:uncharacterized protein (UPF0332 family)